MTKKPRAKRPRLKRFTYKGQYRYFLILCTKGRENYFQDREIINLILAVLKEKSEKEKFKVWAYCFMPDHLHLVVEGLDNNCDLKRFVFRFKQKSGYLASKRNRIVLWQKSYYDHVLRKEEDLKEVCKYTWANPVRKGLVQDYKEFPFSGSLVKGIWGCHL